MTERHFAMGEYTGTTTLDSVEFPAVLPAPTFNPPAGAGGLRVQDSRNLRGKPVLTQAAQPLSGP